MEKLEAVLRSMARNAVRLEIGGESGVEVGRFGGLPDVPEGFAWPYFETETCYDNEVKPRPLSFLAQFDCAALAELDREALLPHEGVLSFFYELGSQRWGCNPEDAGCARVYWFPDKASLSPAAFPEDLEGDFRLQALAFRGRRAVEYPSYEEYPWFLPESGPETAEGWNVWDMFNEVRTALRGYTEEPQPYHRLLGWPDIIQNGMTQECELVSRGHCLGGDWKTVTGEEKRKAAKAALDRWRLLFQLDTVSHGDVELMFGDCGSIYFYIRKEDLAARRFGRVWLIQQCC